MGKSLKALGDIRIIDFSHVFQGPMGTQLLADFGADVVKIERPGGGDWSRHWGPYIDAVSLPYLSLNRNKRSITLDLKCEAGKQVLFQLVETADVLVHNFRPSVMEKLGLGYDELKDTYPKLIYACSTGWGDKGPDVERGRAGHDVMARASAGLFEPLGPNGLPIPVGISADYPAGLLLMIGILTALHAREKTGKGQLVTTDLLSAAFHANTWHSASELNRARITSHDGVGASEDAIRASFKTRDGYIEISPVFSDDALRDLSLALGLTDLSEDPRFVDKKTRPKHADQINAILDQRFLEKSTAEWISILEPQGILCAEVKTYAEAADNPQMQANNMVIEIAPQDHHPLRVLGTPIRLYGTPSSHRAPPPELGQHNTEVLKELGYTDAQIVDFQKLGAFG
jgi:crotonobetainyl-CoA:carnitine CoA-transferase CaiB-like acyl-CoA transferase